MSATNTWAAASIRAGSPTGWPTRLLEGALDAGEEAGVGRRHLFAPLLGELAKQFVLGLGQPGRRVDHDLHHDVAAATAIEMRNAPAPQPQLEPGLGAGRNDEVLGAVQ